MNWRSWLRHCAKSRKVAGSIPDCVTGIFHCGTEVDSVSNRHEYQKYILGDKGGRCVGVTTLPPSCVDCLEILGASSSWNPQGLSRDCITFTLYTHNRLRAEPKTSKLYVR
jgi:hypothetical protein